jgi:hypothetical protein
MGIGCFLVLMKKSKCYKNGNQRGAEKEENWRRRREGRWRQGADSAEGKTEKEKELIQPKEKPKKKS